MSRYWSIVESALRPRQGGPAAGALSRRDQRRPAGSLVPDDRGLRRRGATDHPIGPVLRPAAARSRRGPWRADPAWGDATSSAAAMVETRYYVASAPLSAQAAAAAIRGHWGIDLVFNEDQSRLRNGHGAADIAVVRHFAINQFRTAKEAKRPPRRTARPRRVNPSAAPRKTSIKLRRKIAGCDVKYLQDGPRSQSPSNLDSESRGPRDAGPGAD